SDWLGIAFRNGWRQPLSNCGACCKWKILTHNQRSSGEIMIPVNAFVWTVLRRVRTRAGASVMTRGPGKKERKIGPTIVLWESQKKWAYNCLQNNNTVSCRN